MTGPEQRSDPPGLNASTRLAFAAGGAPSAVVVTLTTGFILLYYSNALGASSAKVGAALALALLFDAMWDPFVGYLSDNTRSCLGRRHPYLYASIIPVTLLCWAVWNPPQGLSSNGLIVYLLATIIPLRLLLALFDVPSSALTAELTSDYDERTRLAAYRTCISWLFITGFSAALYGYWLKATPDYPNGLLNPAGYQSMGGAAAAAVCATMLVCAIGLHPLIPALPIPARHVRSSFGDMMSSVFGAFREPTLIPLLLASASISTGFAIYAALFPYQYAYFWELDSTELSLTTLPWALGLGLGFAATPLLGLVREKRILAGIGIVGLSISIASPVLLAKAGIAPPPGETARFVMLCLFLLFDMLTYLVVTSTIVSMLADAVEHRELRRGRREEGTIFAAQTLVLKVSSALGVFISGVLLEAIGFQEAGGANSAAVIDRLGALWIGGNAGFYLLAVVALLFYRLTRQQHLSNLARLRSGTSDLTTSDTDSGV